MTRREQIRSAVAQPLSPAPAAAQGEQQAATSHDWSARQRLSAVDALRYSRFVAVMRRILPVAAVVLIGSVVAYSVMPRHQDRFVTMPQSGNIARDLTMTKMSFTGTDEKGNPYKVTAAEVIQDPNWRNKHRAELHEIDADMQFENQSWISASAKRGYFDADAGTLRLDGGISVFTDNGYELHTQSADAYIKTNVLEGTEKVSGHGPLGQFSADKFHFDRIHKQLNLSGHVKMRMYPQKSKQKAKKR
jgi:lipopolysaccharide export system protein LptC